jgi:hypothetical protein
MKGDWRLLLIVLLRLFCTLLRYYKCFEKLFNYQYGDLHILNFTSPLVVPCWAGLGKSISS